MATVQDLIDAATALQAIADDQAKKAAASDAADQNVIAVTQAESAKVAAAQTAAGIAESGAQASADSAQAATDAATKALDDAITAIIALARSLAK